MKKLVEGIAEFRRALTPAARSRFASLALGQSPDCLFVACSDSRVVPNLFASTNPGDLFVVRNVGNSVPERGNPSGLAAGAAVEFALAQLGVRDIVVCGHSECGAMRALLDPRGTWDLPDVSRWLEASRDSLASLETAPEFGVELPAHDRLSQLHALRQLEHLRTWPKVGEREARGELTLHAWWFDIAHAEVLAWDGAEGRFLPIGGPAPPRS